MILIWFIAPPNFRRELRGKMLPGFMNANGTNKRLFCDGYFKYLDGRTPRHAFDALRTDHELKIYIDKEGTQSYEFSVG